MVDYIEINNANLTDLFKTDFLDLISKPYNKKAPLLSMIRRDPSLVGNVQAHGVEMSDVGGFSIGSIGTAGDSEFQQTNYTPYKLYQVGRVDAMSIKLARSDEGAFVRLLAKTVKDMKESADRNLSVMLYGNGDGILGTISAVTNTDPTFVLTLSDFHRANLRKSDVVHVEASTDDFRVVSVDRANSQVTVKRLNGSKVPAVSDNLHIQNTNANSAVTGLKKALDATSGSLYGITVGDGWKATQLAASSKPLRPEHIIDVMYDIADETGEFPNLIVCGLEQMKRLIKLGEDNKVLSYSTVSANDFTIGNVPHVKLEGRDVPVIYDQYCDNDRVYLLNTEHIVFRTTGGGEFEAGTDGFLHHELMLGNDVYQLLFKQYGEIFINPTYHGVITGLATTAITA